MTPDLTPEPVSAEQVERPRPELHGWDTAAWEATIGVDSKKRHAIRMALAAYESALQQRDERIAEAEEREQALREALERARGALQPWDGSYPSRTAAMEALNILIEARNALQVSSPKASGEGT